MSKQPPPDVPVALPKPEDRLARAIGHFDAGELATAEEMLVKLREQEPANATAALYLGRVYFDWERYGPAVDQLEVAVALDGEEVDHYLWLGKALGERIHRVLFLQQAPMARRILAVFIRAVELDPDSVPGHIALARFYSEAPAFVGGDRDKSLHHAAELIRLAPVEGHFLLSSIHQLFGELEVAEQELLRAIDRRPRRRGRGAGGAASQALRQRSDVGLTSYGPWPPAGLPSAS